MLEGKERPHSRQWWFLTNKACLVHKHNVAIEVAAMRAAFATHLTLEGRLPPTLEALVPPQVFLSTIRPLTLVTGEPSQPWDHQLYKTHNIPIILTFHFKTKPILFYVVLSRNIKISYLSYVLKYSLNIKCLIDNVNNFW